MDGVITWKPRVGVSQACQAFGIKERTWRHHCQDQRGDTPERPSRARCGPPKPHPAALTKDEKQVVLEVLCSSRFCDVGVLETWATLLDEGTYLCSARTMHRVLAEHHLTGERRQSRYRERAGRPRLVATAPNQVWCWDITRLRGSSKGEWFYLYVIYDLWSRKIVGWTIDAAETAAVAENLITVTAEREQIGQYQLTIHSDRGAQMVSGTLTELYDVLGVRRSLSRPRVSNDNPHAEAGFKTLKYRPDWPGFFSRIEDAVEHCESFIGWYNHEHHHTGIGLLTPVDRHAGRGYRIGCARQATLDQAFEQYPERFAWGRPRPPSQPERVWINPPSVQAR